MRASVHRRVFLTYSASATDAIYCLGMLVASDTSDLHDPRSWTKSAQPVFRSSAATGQWGPGHNSLVRPIYVERGILAAAQVDGTTKSL